ncbi:MAG: RHS repeat-associated core domain-containing protein [Nitrospiraceae bacterium]
MRANGQRPVAYGYDTASRLTQVAQGTLAVGLGYDNANRRTSLTYPNGTSTSYGYDVASRLTGITHTRPSGIIEALTYQYDAGGSRTSLTRNNATASVLPAAVASATYDPANEQTTFSGATLQYDANGNLTNDGANMYVWDSRNRLVSMSGSATANFNYDALGRRTNKTINGVASQFIYDRSNIVAEIGGGAVGASYLRSLNIDEPFIRQSGIGNEYYHSDALGSALVLSNAQGNSTANYTYEAFGKTTVTGANGNPFQFTGRENDGIGIYYYRARYYHPRIQRFINEDPIGLRGGINLYSYASQNPLMFRDPMGLIDLGNTFDALTNVFSVSGEGEYYGSAIGGAIGFVAFTPFGPVASVAGAIVGAGTGGILGSAFDNPCAGQLNCQEVVPLIIGDRPKNPPTGGRK